MALHDRGGDVILGIDREAEPDLLHQFRMRRFKKTRIIAVPGNGHSIDFAERNAPLDLLFDRLRIVRVDREIIFSASHAVTAFMRTWQAILPSARISAWIMISGSSCFRIFILHSADCPARIGLRNRH